MLVLSPQTYADLLRDMGREEEAKAVETETKRGDVIIIKNKEVRLVQIVDFGDDDG